MRFYNDLIRFIDYIRQNNKKEINFLSASKLTLWYRAHHISNDIILICC